MPMHLAAVPASRLRRATRAVLAACGAFALAITLALAAAGGTYAYFSSTAQLSAGTLTAGTAGLRIQNVEHYTIPGLDTSALTGGSSVITSTSLVVSNIGDTPLRVTQGTVSFATDAQTTAVKNYLTITVSRVAGSTCTIGGGTPLSTPYTLAAGGTMRVCVEVGLSASAPYGTVAGKTAAFTVPLDGSQVRP